MQQSSQWKTGMYLNQNDIPIKKYGIFYIENWDKEKYIVNMCEPFCYMAFLLYSLSCDQHVLNDCQGYLHLLPENVAWEIISSGQSWHTRGRWYCKYFWTTLLLVLHCFTLHPVSAKVVDDCIEGRSICTLSIAWEWSLGDD